MATKMYNSHLNTIMEQCKEYYILDVYISLVHMSNEVDSLYLIQLYDHKKGALIKAIEKYINVRRDTIRNCVDKLINLNILKFDELNGAWVLVDMEYMTKEKDYDCNNVHNSKKFSGYTKIRNFFLTPVFTNMKAREKRIIIFLTELADSKASKHYKDFSLNLLKPGNQWLKVLKTINKYYAKYTIKNMLKKYKNLFIDKNLDEKENVFHTEKAQAFKFNFSCSEIKNEPSENEVIELVKSTHPKEYKLIMDRVNFGNITLSKKKIMQFIRVIANVKEWFLKERIVQLIVNKFIANQIHRSRETIKSLPAYGASVVKAVVEEYTAFKTTLRNNTLCEYEIGEYYR